jgi:hypothetical protein
MSHEAKKGVDSYVNSVDSLTELPTKQLLIQAGYRETDLRKGIEYLNKAKDQRKQRIKFSQNKMTKIMPTCNKLSVKSDNRLKHSTSKKSIVTTVC